MKRRLYWTMVGVCLVGSGYQALQYQREQRWLAGKAQAIVQAVNARSREEQIKALRDYIRHHVRDEGLSDQTELAPQRWVLVDVQENPATNPFLDRRWWTVDQATSADGSPFLYYTTINLRRLPVVNLFVHQLVLQSGWVSWVLENPPLIRAYLFASIAVFLISLWMLDLVLLKAYSRRLRVIPAGMGAVASRPV